MPNDGPPDGYITSAEACERLSISDRTLRRRVAAGTIQGEYLPRPQGSVLYIRLPEQTAMQAAHTADTVSASESDVGGKDTAETPTPATEPPAATTGLLAIIEGDRETIRAKDAVIERLHGENATLHERVGRAEAERDSLRAEVERLRWRWWHRWTRGETPPA